MSAWQRRWSSAAFGLALVLSAAATAAAADSPTPASTVPSAEGEESATLRILNRDVVLLRARVGGLTPQQRVQRTQQRLRELPPSAVDQPLGALPSSSRSRASTTRSPRSSSPRTRTRARR